MALASGHWVEKEIAGVPPSPRYGHAIAVAGNIAFLYGGVSTMNSEEDQPLYLNDFYMITVTPTRVTWEIMPQNGAVPTAREGHTVCVVKGKLYLFGGSCHPQATECLPGVYCFDIVTLRWEKVVTGGVALRTLRHSSAALGDNIYVYGGIVDGTPTDNLMMFNTTLQSLLSKNCYLPLPHDFNSLSACQCFNWKLQLWPKDVPCTVFIQHLMLGVIQQHGHENISMIWTPIKTTGTSPSARYNHMCTAVNEQIFLFGGCGEDGSYYKDIHVLNTETLVWQKCEIKGESPVSCIGQTFTAHHDKDIYLFGGTVTGPEGTVSSTNEIHKLSIAKMKWKVPLYVGIPPARRYGHTAFILHSHIYVFGGKNEEQGFNDLKIMKLINPSERQPVMKEILSEFGLQGVSNSFVPTKVPNVKYELSETPLIVKIERTESTQPTAHRDFTTVRDEAMSMIHKAFTILDEEFRKLDREKSELSQAVEELRCERQAYNEYHQKQTQELQEMLERHRAQNEAWLRARAEENDKERKELCKLREEVLHEQEKLKEEQCNIQKRSEHLLSIMQQFKGM